MCVDAYVDLPYFLGELLRHWTEGFIGNSVVDIVYFVFIAIYHAENCVVMFGWTQGLTVLDWVQIPTLRVWRCYLKEVLGVFVCKGVVASDKLACLGKGMEIV